MLLAEYRHRMNRSEYAEWWLEIGPASEEKGDPSNCLFHPKHAFWDYDSHDMGRVEGRSTAVRSRGWTRF